MSSSTSQSPKAKSELLEATDLAELVYRESFGLGGWGGGILPILLGNNKTKTRIPDLAMQEITKEEVWYLCRKKVLYTAPTTRQDLWMLDILLWPSGAGGWEGRFGAVRSTKMSEMYS